MKKMYYIGGAIGGVNIGYIQKVKNKKEKKVLKDKGYIFFETFEHASNYRIADILG